LLRLKNFQGKFSAVLISQNRGQQIGCRSVVSESLADVHVQVDITGAENEASPELKRILAQFVLPVSGCTGSFPCQ
jgi:hypothetical protein